MKMKEKIDYIINQINHILIQSKFIKFYQQLNFQQIQYQII